jgi:pantoate--beta-alanine ligase
MILTKTKEALRQVLDGHLNRGKLLGFVPTMGALHDGHLSLIESSMSDNSITVCSIFVNPTQFNDPADFQKYPVTIDQDIFKLEKTGCDVLFLPAVNEIYPDNTGSRVHYDIGYLETILEGEFRPGHYQGVCQVMDRLLNVVKPDNLYLGQKDYQQCMVINRLLQLKSLDTSCTLHVCPTLRDPDGLAMSSRNMRLTARDRAIAPAIYRVLSFLKEHIKPGDLEELKNKAVQLLETEGFIVDYIEIADAATLNRVKNWDGKQKLVALAAAFLNDVRLIDNLIL